MPWRDHEQHTNDTSKRGQSVDPKSSGPKPMKRGMEKFRQRSAHNPWKVIRSSAFTKLNLCIIIYKEGKEKFGELIQWKNIHKEPGRQERKILKLVKKGQLSGRPEEKQMKIRLRI